MNIVNAKVALDRIQSFIEADEMQQPPLRPPADPAIAVANGTFAWSLSSPPLLHNITLCVDSGHLVMVTGSVGAGKSSLLAALLGEMSAKQGSVTVAGSIAYTQQDPWIRNASLRDNILMGIEYEQTRYEAVLEACALLPDLGMLPAGDATEIGEKGVNLSGGQRHRVALARACYANADVYLFDDPLSAVDAHVGRHLFEKCMMSHLGGTTRILVTHQLQYLESADVVVVIKDGRIAEQGSYAALIEKGVDFHQFKLDTGEDGDGDEKSSDADDVVVEDLLDLAVITTDTNADKTASSTTLAAVQNSEEMEDVPLNEDQQQQQQLLNDGNEDSSSAPALKKTSSPSKTNKMNTDKDAESRAAAAQLTKAEERAMGQVDRKVYARYFAAYGPLMAVPILVLTLAVTERGLQAAQNWWLSVWTEATTVFDDEESTTTTDTNTNTHHYMRVYFIFGIISLVFQVSRAVALVLGSITAARHLQASLLETVLRLPMSFFDSQPTGRLLNRFTKDTEAVDSSIQSSVASFLNCAVSVLWSLVIVIAVSPWVALALIPLGIAYTFVQNRFLATSRELKRLDSLALSPIFSHFAETLAGLTTLRAFRAQDRFIAQDAVLLNESNRCYWPAQ